MKAKLLREKITEANTGKEYEVIRGFYPENSNALELYKNGIPRMNSVSRINNFLRPFQEYISPIAAPKLEKELKLQIIADQKNADIKDDILSKIIGNNSNKTDELLEIAMNLEKAREFLNQTTTDAQNDGKYAEEIVTAYIEKRNVDKDVVRTIKGEKFGELMIEAFKSIGGEDLELLPNNESHQLVLCNPDMDVWDMSKLDGLYRRKSTGKLVLVDYKAGSPVKAQKLSNVVTQLLGNYYWNVELHYNEEPAEVYVISAYQDTKEINGKTIIFSNFEARDLINKQGRKNVFVPQIERQKYLKALEAIKLYNEALKINNL